MLLEVQRFSTGQESTLGLLMDITYNPVFLCYTLEDTYNSTKIYGETRIPSGKYQVKLRKEGGFHSRYTRKFGSKHRGMLQIMDVPGYEYILIHVGNDDEDTKGCLLVGDTIDNNQIDFGFIGKSTQAYKRIYPLIAETIENGEEVWIKYTDID